MVYPATNSVRELIVSNVKTTLEAINGAGSYRTTVQKVLLVGRSSTTASIHEYPCAVIAPPEIEWTDAITHIYRAKMRLGISLAMRNADAAIGSTDLGAIYDFVEDVKLALTVDLTRGGYAVDTQVEADSPYMPFESMPILAADVTATITFGHLKSDPGTAM